MYFVRVYVICLVVFFGLARLTDLIFADPFPVSRDLLQSAIVALAYALFRWSVRERRQGNSH